MPVSGYWLAAWMIASIFPASSSALRSSSHRAGSGVMKARYVREVEQVLAGVVEVGDVGGVGVELPGHGPDPGGAVADGDDLAEVLAAAAQVLGFHQAGQGVLAVEGGHVAGGARVHHRVAALIEGGDGDQAGQLDLAGPGAAVIGLALAAFGFAAADRDAGAVHLDIQHVRDRLGRGQRPDRAGADRGGLRSGIRPDAYRILGGPLRSPGAQRFAGRQRGGLAEGDLRAGPGDDLAQARRQRLPGCALAAHPRRRAMPAFGQ